MFHRISGYQVSLREYINPFCKVIFLALFVLTAKVSFSQSLDDIKKRTEKAEQEIKYLNKLLDQTRNDKTASVQNLNILNQKIQKGKELVASLNSEVKFLENLIQSNEKTKSKLEENKKKMTDLYSKLVYETWKKRKHSNKLVHIFSSSGFSQAYARYKYFEQIQDYSKKQIESIHNTNDSLTKINNDLSDLLSQKSTAQKEINAQNSKLIKEQNQANSYIAELQKKEKELIRKLNAEKKNREKLNSEMQKIIAAQAKKSGGSGSSLKLTPQEKLISDDFAKNKGRLPWPVEQGFISEKFGVNTHPVFKQVKMTNDGITITTSLNADVRTVFSGVVTEIMFISGNNNVVIVRHGNYYSVYSNIVEVYVKKGSSVNVKQSIGKLAAGEQGNSTLNFQIWKDKDVQNPQLWLVPQ